MIMKTPATDERKKRVDATEKMLRLLKGTPRPKATAIIARNLGVKFEKAAEYIGIILQTSDVSLDSKNCIDCEETIKEQGGFHGGGIEQERDKGMDKGGSAGSATAEHAKIRIKE